MPVSADAAQAPRGFFGVYPLNPVPGDYAAMADGDVGMIRTGFPYRQWKADHHRFDSIVRSANFNTVIGESEADVARRLDALEARVAPYLGPDATRRFMNDYRGPSAIAVGTPDQVVERLLDMKRRGLGYAIHYFPELAYDRTGLELYEREVLPALR